MPVRHRSPTSAPHDDLEEKTEALMHQLESIPLVLWSPALRTAFNSLAWASARLLLELHARGRIEFVCHKDGTFDAVLLDRVQH
jgi:hypothetical protein